MKKCPPVPDRTGTAVKMVNAQRKVMTIKLAVKMANAPKKDMTVKTAAKIEEENKH